MFKSIIKKLALTFCLVLTGGDLYSQVNYKSENDSIILCGDQIVIRLNDYVGDIHWQKSLDGVSWQTIPGENNDSLVFIADTTSYYRAEVIAGDCDPFYSDSVRIIVVKRSISAEGVIGSEGGTVKIEDSNSILNGAFVSIPPGALEDSVLIRISTPDNDRLFHEYDSNIIVRFEPDGLIFNLPVEIGVPFDMQADTTNLRIINFNPDSLEIYYLPFLNIDYKNKIATAEIGHFSYYTASDNGARIKVELLNIENKIGVRLKLQNLDRIRTSHVYWPATGLFNVWSVVLDGIERYSVFTVQLFRRRSLYFDEHIANRSMYLHNNTRSESYYRSAVYKGYANNGVFLLETPIFTISDVNSYGVSSNLGMWNTGEPFVFYFDDFNPDDNDNYYVDVRWFYSEAPHHGFSHRVTPMYEFGGSEYNLKIKEMTPFPISQLHESKAVDNKYIITPNALFIGSPTSGKAPLTVQFTDQSTNNPTTLLWEFGDNTISTQQNPTKIYSTAGLYTVNLTVSNENGSNTNTKINYIIVEPGNSGDWPRDTQTKVVDVTNPATGKTWMDRNLGASRAATSSTDAEAYGDLYQWGRAADGHQKRNSFTTMFINNNDTPDHGNFILPPSSPYDWRSPQNDNLWQEINGVNNPCPQGYRLPTEAEINTERQSWSSNNSSGAFASPLKLPVAGLRLSSFGSLGYVGSNGNYWSSSVDGIYSRGLNFNSSNAELSDNVRAIGSSVRCLKESTAPSVPSANFSGTPTSGNAPLTVQFTDQSTNNPTSWSWNFGDGSTSSQRNPSKTYNSPGTYTVGLTVTNSHGSNTHTKNNYIKVLTNREYDGQPCPGMSSLTDTRDGKSYRTIQIGNQCWMKDNLKYLPIVVPRSVISITQPFYYVWAYEGSNTNAAEMTENYKNYGVLYNFTAAVNACPTGWHLPNDIEWNQLIDYLNLEYGIVNENIQRGVANTLKSCRKINSPLGGDCSTEMHPRWDNQGSFYETDDFGFSALPGGFIDINNTSWGLGVMGTWYSKTEISAQDASSITMVSGTGNIFKDVFNKAAGFSVRCVKDAD